MKSEEDIAKIIGQPEGEQLEYKAVLPPAKTIGQLISAFANNKGGIIVLGVAVKGNGRIEAVGLSEDFRVNSIVHKALDMLTPKPKVEYFYSNYKDKRIYIVEVSKSIDKVYIEGKIFKRVGALSILKNPPEKILKANGYSKIEILNKKLEALSCTEAMSKFINHMQGVLNIVSDLSPLLYPTLPSEQTNNPEGKILMRILFSSCADNFETYLSDLLYEIYLANPATLKSDETVMVKEVLECTDIQEFINYFAKKKLSKLKRGSVTAFLSENKQIDKLNAISQVEQKEIEKILQIRHLYAHNNGVADEKFLKYFPTYSLNESHEMSVDIMLDYLEYLGNVVLQIDIAAIAKFSLASSISR